jgi:hypothetical protein
VVDLLLPRVVLVVEGVARVVAAEATTAAVLVVAAAASGDDAILAEAAAAAGAGRPVLAVTADRGLAARLAAVGVPRAGPRWLLDRIG